MLRAHATTIHNCVQDGQRCLDTYGKIQFSRGTGISSISQSQKRASRLMERNTGVPLLNFRKVSRIHPWPPVEECDSTMVIVSDDICFRLMTLSVVLYFLLASCRRLVLHDTTGCAYLEADTMIDVIKACFSSINGSAQRTEHVILEIFESCQHKSQLSQVN